MAMEDTIVLNGKTYVKATKAARDAGYTSDYVGQLCRGKKIDAKLIGRSWYVNPDELSVHRTEKKRASRSKAREQAKKAIAEARTKQNAGNVRHFENRIRYERDDSELIPQVRKVPIEKEPVAGYRSTPVAVVSKNDPGYVIENKGKKIIMSGPVTVIDATDEVEDAHVTYLQPTIDKKTKPARPKKKTFDEKMEEYNVAVRAQGDEEPIGEVADVYENEVPITGAASSGEEADFMEKLVAHEVVAGEVSVEDHTKNEQKSQSSVFTPVMLTLSLAILVAVVVLQGAWRYSSTEVQGQRQVQFETAFVVDAVAAIEKIKLTF